LLSNGCALSSAPNLAWISPQHPKETNLMGCDAIAIRPMCCLALTFREAEALTLDDLTRQIDKIADAEMRNMKKIEKKLNELGKVIRTRRKSK
jgi:hypothetical protein